MWRRFGRLTLSGVLGVLLALPSLCGTVAAHELGADRFDAPIPLPALFLGAAATIALTAAWLGRSQATIPPSKRTLGAISGSAVRRLAVVGQLLFGALLVAVVFLGVVGRQVGAENLATVFVWPVWLKGLGIVAILLGSPWRLLSPWRGVQSLLERLEAGELRLRPYPDRLGDWPAVVGFVLVVGILENLTVVPRSPTDTAGLVALYAALMVGGGVVFGTAWFRHADPIEVLYRQLARVAPVRATWTGDDGGRRIELRYPWQGCLLPVTSPGAVTFLVAMVYTVSFDGFTNTPEYQSLHFALADSLGQGFHAALVLYLTGLLGFVATFLGAMRLVDALAESGARGTADAAGTAGPVDGERAMSSGGVTARAFAPTIVPIAAAYELAHNYPFVLENLARLVELIIAAVGVTPPDVSLLGWLSVPAFWASQVVLIVLGHAIAVVAAHAVAVDRYESLPRARRAHLPLVVVMVGYTVLSLWIVSRPVVTG